MTDTAIALTVTEVFPHSQLLEFLHRGSVEAVNTISRYLRGRTYEEWFEYFEAQNFQPILREVPIMTKVLIACYRGMVLQAQDAANAWSTLSADEREKYKRTALEIAKRERPSWSFSDRLECAFNSFLVFHNFFKDVDLQDKLLNKFVAIVFEAVATEREPLEKSDSEREMTKDEKFQATSQGIEEENESFQSGLSTVDWLTKEKAQTILNSMWVKIPESERDKKSQELRGLLKKWQEEDVDERYNDTP